MTSPAPIDARDAPLAYDLREILTGFGVRLHYEASAGGRVRRYAVWDSRFPGASVQVSDPDSHANAQARCRDLQVAAIIELLNRRKA